MRALFVINIIFLTLIYVAISAPLQEPETKDQFEESNHTEIETSNVEHSETKNNQHEDTKSVIEDINVPLNTSTDTEKSEISDIVLITEVKKELSFMRKLYIAIRTPIMNFVELPRVNTVLKNIGTCIVNGAMEIVSFYFPAPLIPLIASAAGMIIPFEPVVMLRKRMPVTSYRRAFKTAIKSFIGTFDRFKASTESEDDPYMTRRFNTKFLGDSSKTLANED